MMTAIASQMTDNEIPTATNETTDDALIAKAKGLNRSMERHLRKGIEAFYLLGETLTALYKRRHLHADGRWSVILKEIGISTTTDNHARRLFQSCEFADLANYKNKTEALRALGIIATKEWPERASKPTALVHEQAQAGCGAESIDPRDVPTDDGMTSQENHVEHEDVAPEVGIGVGPAPEHDCDRDLLTLARIATLLESLAEKGLAPSADDLAQLDRIVAVVARMREVAYVAAA